ncbi:MAG: NmrA/HSCARG family protein [Labilithrix sp.]|nr:NmrA/HSCARG family protein [Labilithrix sp.]MBX3211340.1 NmrA/HSCARG family protein [Labilithrix sp.]
MQKQGLVLVLGATGQQGGATARALRRDGWRVRALVRDPASAKAKALAAIGVELVRGDYRDRSSLDAALAGAYGVFSIQPSSGQPEYGLTDEDELRFGTDVVDGAQAAGVTHLVYTSVGGLRPNTGVGHFESKWKIEEHVRGSRVPATIVRPAAFMEILLLPHFGLGRDSLVFFLSPDQPMQFIAVEDIGALVALVFAEPSTYVGKTVDIAAESLTGNELAAKLTRAVGRPVSYARFSPAVLAENALLRRLVELVDEGAASGDADIPAIRRIHPGILTFDAWLAKTGKAAIEATFASSE